MAAKKGAAKPAKKTKQVRVGSIVTKDYSANLRADKYEAMEKAMLKAVPRKPPGSSWQEMLDAVEPLVSKEMFPGTTHGWWMKSVQLNLEKQGRLLRDPKAKPLRWHRVK